jgi:hypothetical protein
VVLPTPPHTACTFTTLWRGQKAGRTRSTTWSRSAPCAIPRWSGAHPPISGGCGRAAGRYGKAMEAVQPSRSRTVTTVVLGLVVFPLCAAPLYLIWPHRRQLRRQRRLCARPTFRSCATSSCDGHRSFLGWVAMAPDRGVGNRMLPRVRGGAAYRVCRYCPLTRQLASRVSGCREAFLRYLVRHTTQFFAWVPTF